MTPCPSTGRSPGPCSRPPRRPDRPGRRLDLRTGPVPGPVRIGHECIGQVVTTGDEVTDLAIGQTVVVPWAVSCGSCPECLRGVTAKCSITRSTAGSGTLAAFALVRVRAVWRDGRRRDPGAVRGPHAGARAGRHRPAAHRRGQRQPRRRVAGRRAAAARTTRRLRAGARRRGTEHRPVRRRPRRCPRARPRSTTSTTGPSAWRSRRPSGRCVHQIDRNRRRSQLSAIPGRYDVAVEASSAGSGAGKHSGP